MFTAFPAKGKIKCHGNYSHRCLNFIYYTMAEALKKVGNYKLIKKIGSGATSQVFQGRKQNEIEKYAVKMIKIKNMTKQQKEMIAKQVVIIKSIEHPNIVKLYQTLETPNNYYLIFEFCEKGDLEKYLKENMDNLLPPENVRKIIRCIADAISLLHARGIAHRDIKLANVLLKKDFTIKLADFGFARESNNEEVMMKTYCGTPITMAPQILQGRPYDKKCDIWSLGVILFQLIFGKLPFPVDQGYLVFISKVTNEKVKIPTTPSIPEALAKLLYCCLERDQFKRYSIEQFLESEWMKGESNLKVSVAELKESVCQVLKKVSKDASKKGEVQEQEKDELQRVQKLLANRIHQVLHQEINKIIQRHINIRGQLFKLVQDIKQLSQVLFFYDYEILCKLKSKQVRIRLEGQKDVSLSVSNIRTLLVPQTLSEKQPQPCQAGVVIMNYLKKLSSLQEFDLQKKRNRYEIVIKFLDFIQNFQLELILFVNNGYQADLNLQNVVENIKKKQNNEDEEEAYNPTLNQITIAIECREKQEKFREYANILKSNCLKRIDSIQKEINGY